MTDEELLQEGKRIRKVVAQPREPVNIERAPTRPQTPSQMLRTGEPYRDPREAIPRPKTSASRAPFGIQVPESVQRVANTPITRQSIGDAYRAVKPALKPLAGAVGAGLEGYQAAQDIATPGMTTLDKIARGAESAGRVASAGLGAAVGSVVGPIGTVGGGIAGYLLPSAVRNAYNYFTGNDLELASDKATRLQESAAPQARPVAQKPAGVRDTTRFPVAPPAQPAEKPKAAKPSIDSPTARVPKVQRAAPAAAPVAAPAVAPAPQFEPVPLPQVTRRTLDTTPYTPEQQQAIYAINSGATPGGNVPAKPAGINYITNDQLFAMGEQGPRFTVPQDNAVYTNSPGNVTAAPGSNIAVVGPGERYFAAGNVAVPQAVGDVAAPAYLSAQRQAAIDQANPVDAEIRARLAQIAATGEQSRLTQGVENEGRLAATRVSSGPAYQNAALAERQYKDMLEGKGGAKNPLVLGLPEHIVYDQFGNPVKYGGGQSALLPSGQILAPSIEGGFTLQTPGAPAARASVSQVHAEAQRAIQAGASKDAVNARLIQNGYPALPK